MAYYPPVSYLYSRINATASIHETAHGVIDLGKILDLNAYSAQRSAARASIPLALRDSTDSLVARPNGPHDHDACADPASCKVEHSAVSRHDLSSIRTLSIPLPLIPHGKYDLFDRLVRSLLWEGRLSSDALTPSANQVKSADGAEKRCEILRTKGIFSHVDDQGRVRACVVQGVRELYEFRQLPGGGSEEEGKIVFIGKELKEGLRDEFLRLLHEE